MWPPPAIAVRYDFCQPQVLTTGNEAGGAAMLVQRPANVLPLAA